MELLVVIAILAILAVAATRLFSSKEGPSITQAGTTVSGVADLGRQNAMTKNSLTALVVAEVTEGGQPRSAVSLWEVTEGQNAQQVERWNLLPDGILAKNTGTVSTNSLTGCSYRGQTLNNPAIYLFYPDGRVGDGSAVAKLRIEPRVGATNNYYELVFNPVIGTHKVVRP